MPPATYPLTLLIGLPGSGKSTLAAQWMQAENRSLISTDTIRAMLFGNEATQGEWGLVQREVRRQLQQAIDQIQQGKMREAIYDATNARRRNRRQAIALIRSLGFSPITGFWLDLPLSVCLERNRRRSRQVPEEVIYRMHRQLTDAPPRLEDGFDRLVHLLSFS